MLNNKDLDWTQDGKIWPRRELSQFIDAGGYRWHVQISGVQNRPPMLLLHGTGASLHSWSYLAPILEKDFKMISIDLPGHGFTRASRYRSPTIGHVAKSIGMLMNAIEVNPDFVIGHSAGAAIMIEMMARGVVSPHMGVSINGALMPFAGAAGFLFPVMAKMLHISPLTAPFFANSARDPRRVKRLIEQTGSNPPLDSVACYSALFANPRHVGGALAMMANWDLSGMPGHLRSLEQNLIFIAGEDDKAVPPGDAPKCAALARNSSVHAVNGLGHLAHEEAPDMVANIIFAETKK